jgi:hypothetical protein
MNDDVLVQQRRYKLYETTAIVCFAVAMFRWQFFV